MGHLHNSWPSLDVVGCWLSDRRQTVKSLALSPQGICTFMQCINIDEASLFLQQQRTKGGQHDVCVMCAQMNRHKLKGKEKGVLYYTFFFSEVKSQNPINKSLNIH